MRNTSVIAGKTPKLFLIVGSNGASNTTCAFRHIRDVAGSAQFVNLDKNAPGLSSLAPTQARSRVALDMTCDFIAARSTFLIETTLLGWTHLRTIAAAHDQNSDVHLLYFLPPLCSNVPCPNFTAGERRWP